jgi:hypothetical protein
LIQHLSADEFGGIAARGGSLEVNGVQFSAADLGGIAARLSHGATLKIHNSARWNADEMGGIAARKSGQVFFC